MIASQRDTLSPLAVSDNGIPKTAEDVTVDWLRRILPGSAASGRGAIESFEVHQVPSGYGISCSYARIRLRYESPRAGAPEGVFVKFSKDDHASKSLSELEFRFYNDIAPIIRLPIPRCYYAGRDEDDGMCVIVLEDLSHGSADDSLAGCSSKVAELLVREMGAFHGRCWENPLRSRWEWIQPSAAPGGIIDRIRECWPGFKLSHATVLGSTVIEAGDRALEHLPSIWETQTQEAPTLIHGDFKLDNVQLDVSDSPFVLLDWQLVRCWQCARDLMWFLARSLPIEQRRTQERRLVDVYYRALVDSGARNFFKEDLLYDMNLALLFNLLIDSVTSAAGPRPSKRGELRLRASIERDVKAIEDYRAWEVLG